MTTHSIRSPRWLGALLLTSIAACSWQLPAPNGDGYDANDTDALGDTIEPGDGARPDGTVPDADAPDAIGPDAIGPDAVAPDGSTSDVTVSDVQVLDGSDAMVGMDVRPNDVPVVDVVTPDATGMDASMPDAGPPDATVMDAGPVDACTLALTMTYYRDNDGDGRGNPTLTVRACAAPTGYVTDGTDCNDSDATIHPGATELCDGIDRNCDNQWNATVPGTCATIQAGIDAVRTGVLSTVTVAPGVYSENVDFKGKRVTVRSAQGAAMTTIRAVRSGSVVRFVTRETTATVLSGFTITGGSGDPVMTSQYGGGIHVSSASPTLRDLVITGNRVDTSAMLYEYGGGIALRSSGAVLENIRIDNNFSRYYGGGLYVSQGTPRISHVALLANQTNGYGGGAAFYSTGIAINNVIVAGNRAGADGGGAFIQFDPVAWVNATFVGNTAGSDGGALALSRVTGATALTNVTVSGGTAMNGGAIAVSQSGSVTIEYSNFYNNGLIAFSGITPPLATSGNLMVDPMFVSLTGAATSWDLHLRPGSPLRDAGSASLRDADGTRSDIGAYGGPASQGWR